MKIVTAKQYEMVKMAQFNKAGLNKHVMCCKAVVLEGMMCCHLDERLKKKNMSKPLGK